MNTVSIINPSIVLVKPFAIKGSFILKLFGMLIILTMLLVLVYCIFQLNRYTQETYFISQYENRINQLTQENKNLEVNFSKVNSLNHMGNYVQNFEKAEKIEYIQVLDSMIAAK